MTPIHWLASQLVRLQWWWFGKPGVSEPATEARLVLFGVVVFFGWLTFWTWRQRKQLTVDLFQILPIFLQALVATAFTLMWPWLLVLACISLPFVVIVGGILLYAHRERRVVAIACQLRGEPLPDEYLPDTRQYR